jgi:transcriptional regulator with XRE-family HTH domain
MAGLDELTQTIAARVRAERHGHGWSLEELATRAEVSKGVLVQIENARTNPSIGTLCRVADALGVSLARLVDNVDEPPVVVHPPERAAVLWEGERPGSTGTLFAGADGPNWLELWEWRLARGEEHPAEAHSPGTVEMLHVYDGVLTLVVGDHEVEVPAGHTAVFRAEADHTYANRGRSALRFVMVVTGPSDAADRAMVTTR